MRNNESRRTRVAAEVRAELARQRMSQAQLSTATGIKPTTLRSRLDGVPPFSLDDVDTICRALKVPFIEFMRRTEVAEAHE